MAKFQRAKGPAKVAIRHGLRASNLPTGCAYIEGQLNAFRRDLIAELRSMYGDEGSLPMYVDGLVQSAMRHESRALLAARWLRIEPDLKLADRLSLVATISASTDQRDKALRGLGIDPLNSPDLLAGMNGGSSQKSARACITAVVSPTIPPEPAPDGRQTQADEADTRPVDRPATDSTPAGADAPSPAGPDR